MSDPNPLLRLGAIVGFHGLKGDVKIRAVSDPPDWVETLRVGVLMRPDQPPFPVTITKAWIHDRSVCLRFAELPSRTEAEPWMGATFHAHQADLPTPGDDEYRFEDLMGLTVVGATSGEALATVTDLLSANGEDFLEVTAVGGSATAILPFTHVFFPTVDLANRRMAGQDDLLATLLEEKEPSPPKAPRKKKRPTAAP